MVQKHSKPTFVQQEHNCGDFTDLFFALLLQ